MTSRPYFQHKHYEVMTKNCAALLIACNESVDAYKAVAMTRAMFEADSDKFKSELFLKRINELMEAR